VLLSSVNIAKLLFKNGFSFVPSWLRIDPFLHGPILLTASRSEAKKFFVLKEKTASIACGPVFLNVYSRAPTGRLELFSSVGIKGLQPVIFDFRGRSESRKVT
jgi:hypothetical protein